MPRFSGHAARGADLSSRSVGLHAAKSDPEHGRDSDFAATVVSLPPSADGVWPEAPGMPLTEPPPSDALVDGPGDGAADTLADAPTLQHIGRYALKHRLGEGGLGCVFEAWDPLLSRTVAVKTLQFDVDAPERLALDRLFLNEARAVAGLNHPHIVTVHDAGLSAHGVYIAMERLRGRDLRQAIAGGWRPTPGQAALLVRRVADALAYAHARGVVHCDIKPANIFLTRKDRPKVLDFGIARIVHGAQVSRSAVQPDWHAAVDSPLDGLVAGSPHYLAPEQLQGGAIDARTDVYALGVVLYELLAGRKAFDGGSLAQITSAVLHAHPASADTLRPEVPAGLAAVAARAMARDPAARFASAAELAQALRPWQARGPAPEEQPAPAVPAPAAARLRRWMAGPVVGAAMALGAAATWWWQAPSEPGAAPAVAAGPGARAADTAVPAAAGPAMAGEPTPAGAAPADAAPAPPADLPAAAAATAPARPAAARPRPARPQPAATATAPAAPVAPGTLRLAISPWGEVEVDGQPAGVTPPLSTLSLTAGTHRITVRNGDFPPFTTEVQVESEQTVTLRHRFGS